MEREHVTHELTTIKHLIDLSANRLRCFLTVNELREKIRSVGTEDAEMARKSRAMRAMFGYLSSFIDHHFNTSTFATALSSEVNKFISLCQSFVDDVAEVFSFPLNKEKTSIRSSTSFSVSDWFVDSAETCSSYRFLKSNS